MSTQPPAASWETISHLVGELADLAPMAREDRLAAIADSAIRTAVAGYLAALDTDGDLFERPAHHWLSGDDETTDPAGLIGTRIGAWRLEALLGHGGMGAVYRAVRESGGFAQLAAIKMLRPDILPGMARERLLRERQLLARLAHRNIATILDGGVTDDGQPWFALELVEGEPITNWCRRHSLGPEARLQLFRQVCNAVQSAHSQLVVHRDLKPSNILVDADGTVKLLDFGIAKLLESEDTGDDELTQVGALPATPTYASPEQLEGERVSTASDIYSLGVVLTELLTGAPPFRAGNDLAAHRRTVRHDAPARLAVAVTPAHAATVSGWSLPRLQRWLDGDIQAVVDAALRKEPEHRYSSVAQFAADITAVTMQHPVAARRDSGWYRLRRLVERNRATSLLVAGLAVALCVTAGVAVNRAYRAERQGAAAALEAARAERVTSFLAGVLTAPDPWTGDRNVTVRELLDQASTRAGADFGDDPAVEARVRFSIGRSYRGLGQIDAAGRELGRAQQLLAAGDDPVRAEVERALAEVLAEQGDYVVARVWYDSAARSARRTGDSTALAAIAADMAWLFGRMGEIDSARLRGREAVALRRSQNAPPVDLANALNNLAVVELEAGRPDSAIGYLDEAVALLRAAGDDGVPPLGAALSVLAGVLSDQGNFVGAEIYYRESLTLRRQVFGEGHPDEIGVMVNLAVNALALDSVARALALADTINMRVTPGGFSEEHPLMAAARTVRGRALVASGRFATAERELRRALALRRGLLPPGHPALAFTLGALADALTGQGKVAQAREAALEAHAILLEAFGSDHPRTREAAKRRSEIGDQRDLPLPIPNLR